MIAVLPGNGEIHHVPSEFPLIQTALDSCAWDDTVLVAPGTYTELILVPATELTLASNYIFSQDTTDINGTILDGEYQGTIVNVLPTGNGRVFSLNGFTVKRGQGWYGEFPWLYGGGAIHARDSVNLVLENCVFTENRSPTYGAVLSQGSGGNQGNLTLRNLQVFNNNPNDPGLWVIYGYNYGYMIIDRLHGRGVGENKRLLHNGADSVYVDGLVLENYVNNMVGVIVLNTLYYMQLENIILSDNSTRPSMLELNALSEGGTVVIRNLHVRDNSPFRYIYVRADTIYADSLFFLRNRGGINTVCAGFVPEDHGQVNHLVVQENAGGVLGYEPGLLGNIITLHCSINDGLFLNDTLYLHNDPDDPNSSAGGRSVLYHSSISEETPSVLENCRFIGNYHDDPDDYSNPNVNGGTQGRVLHIDNVENRGTILRHCLFENNRQPNIAPDRPYNFGGSHGVGSIIFGDGCYQGYGVHLTFEDVLIRNNDDGAINIQHINDVSMRNVQIIDTPRRGIEIYSADNVLLENVLISGVIEQENYFTYPYDWCYHGALFIVATESAFIRNSTITGCNLPFLITPGGQNTVLPEFHNCLIAGNTYEYLRRPDPDGDGNPVYAEYSYIQEEVEGENNIVGNDPQFHTELGVPYLDSVSPCIDAGNPNPIYNDPEDPIDHGFPLWPAQGTLRNDIGFTGGPWAMVQEFEGIADQDHTPVIPQRIQLSQNYPNPFNPTTTIEFTLPSPQQIQLSVYNILGQRVAVLAEGVYAAGMHRVTFEGTRFPSGIYVYRLRSGDDIASRKMMLVR